MSTKWVVRWLSIFTGSTIVAVCIGIYLDRVFHSAPCMILIVLAYAIGGNFYKLWKEIHIDG